MSVAYIQVIVPIDPRYPWHPSQPPIGEKLEQVVSDSLRHLEGVGPITPASCQITITFGEHG